MWISKKLYNQNNELQITNLTKNYNICTYRVGRQVGEHGGKLDLHLLWQKSEEAIPKSD